MVVKIFTFLFILFLLLNNSVAQAQRISGKVTDASLQPLSYVSVKVNALQTGTVTNEEGNFSLSLRSGKYEFVFSLIGYKTQTIIITNIADVVQNVTMEEESKSLDEVQVTVTKKDRAEEIIKNVIKQKERQFTDIADLWVITHEKGSHIAADEQGNLFNITSPLPPVNAVLAVIEVVGTVVTVGKSGTGSGASFSQLKEIKANSRIERMCFIYYGLRANIGK